MKQPTQAELHSIATGVRTRAAAAFAAEFDADDDLRSHCVAVSLYLRDQLRAAGYADAVAVAGYFSITDPDPEVCACGSYDGTHDEACYFEPHAWVEMGGWLIDLTASQFGASVEDDLPDVVIEPLAALHESGPWISSVAWDDDSWQGVLSELRGDWPARLGPAPTN